MEAMTKKGYHNEELREAFEVSRSGNYGHRRRERAPRRQQDAQLRPLVARAFHESRRTYGTPRLRAALRNIYLREHAVNLNKLMGSGKREARKYIESLEGIVPYVSSRLALLSFDTHIVPVDDQLRTLLIEAEVSDNSVENAELGSWLAAQVKAGDGPTTHAALQAWVDEQVGTSGGTEKKAAGKSRKPAKRSKAAA